MYILIYILYIGSLKIENDNAFSRSWKKTVIIKQKISRKVICMEFTNEKMSFYSNIAIKTLSKNKLLDRYE